MLKTLYTRLALGLFVLLVTVGLVYSVISVYTLRDYNASVNQALNRDLARKLVSDRNLISEGQLDQKALKKLFSLYMTINPSIEIYLLDTEGRILSYSADPDKIKRKRVSLTPIRTLLADRSQYPILGDDPRSYERQKVFSVTPIPSADNIQGYLYVVLRGEEYDSAELMARTGHFIEMSAWTVALSLIVGMLAGLAVFRLLTRRLTRLTKLMEAFETGGMTNRLPATWQQSRPVVRDEIDYLGVTFDHMAQRIASQIEQLQEKDALRRRLVAQVSHDLRTPLASMQGYVESLRLKHTTLSEEQRARFLDIALTEGRRLSRLVDELFELAALEAAEKRPCLEPFAPAELVYDVCQKHQPEATRKGIRLTVDGGLAQPLACGDLGMTERVLDNLITNALTYSADAGQVSLIMDSGPSGLMVRVSDTGPGIPDADLPHIFDAFYRGDTRHVGSHAGLGLAIAQRIMALQGGNIEAANNVEGPGATFTITLPLSDA